ncbi:uncharacterized protein METZ01_LOCUS145590 [marine metagenome]|uniref:PLAT domain-containing protein n=1 Tax=marine metagenome TaxID=408172 RepID=A0A381ZU00_9ZZZZ
MFGPLAMLDLIKEARGLLVGPEFWATQVAVESLGARAMRLRL